MMYASDDMDELLGAYALDAVGDDERCEIEQYLLVNPRARAEVAEHREVATMLAWSGAPAPEGVWSRIVDALEEAAPAPGPELARVLPMRPRRSRWATVGAGLVGAAAATVIAVLSVSLVDRNRELDRLRPQAVETAISLGYTQAVNDPAAAKVELLSDDGRTRAQAVVEPTGVGYLAASGLPELADGLTYQLWGVVSGKVISIGVLGPRPEIETFTVAGDLQALVITEEEAGGVPVSSNPAALAGELS